jgi:hypothetical protein
MIKGVQKAHFVVNVKEICDCIKSVLLLVINTVGQPVYGMAGKE